jgi:hypothetical protein
VQWSEIRSHAVLKTHSEGTLVDWGDKNWRAIRDINGKRKELFFHQANGQWSRERRVSEVYTLSSWSKGMEFFGIVVSLEKFNKLSRHLENELVHTFLKGGDRSTTTS